MRHDPRPVQPSTVLALSRTLRAAPPSAASRRHPLLPLRAALCWKPGRDEGMVVSDRTKGCCSSDLNEPPRPTMTNLLNLTHTTLKSAIASKHGGGRAWAPYRSGRPVQVIRASGLRAANTRFRVSRPGPT